MTPENSVPEFEYFVDVLPTFFIEESSTATTTEFAFNAVTDTECFFYVLTPIQVKGNCSFEDIVCACNR